MTLSLQQVSTRRAFVRSVMNQVSACWQVAPGIAFTLRQHAQRAAVALQVERRARAAQQIRHTLARRFEDPLEYTGCYLYLDTRDTLVAWQALPKTPMAEATVEALLGRQFALLGLDALDERPATY